MVGTKINNGSSILLPRDNTIHSKDQPATFQSRCGEKNPRELYICDEGAWSFGKPVREVRKIAKKKTLIVGFIIYHIPEDVIY